LPEFWQGVSKANPILYMVNAFRFGILGTSDISITHAYTILIGFVVVLFSAAFFLMKKGVGIRE
jgi:ABC-2 type transport system permease protein